MTDPIDAARLHIKISEAAEAKRMHHAHIPHTIRPRETGDPSLTQRLVYGNRADWYASAATSGWFDVDKGTKTGAYRFLPEMEVHALAGTQAKGMKLYE